MAAVAVAAAVASRLGRSSSSQGHGPAAAAGESGLALGGDGAARGGVAGAHRDRLPHLAGALHPRRVQVRPMQRASRPPRVGPWKTRSGVGLRERKTAAGCVQARRGARWRLPPFRRLGSLGNAPFPVLLHGGDAAESPLERVLGS